MAQGSPSSVDVQDIQFKLHDKYTIFKEGGELRSYVNLLAVASNQGLLFAGNPNAAELRVAFLKDVVHAQNAGQKLPQRVVPLPSVPVAIACNADGSMLAVNYVQQKTEFLQIYSVPTFAGPGIKTLHTIRLSSEENVNLVQLLWNPVVTNSLAIVLNNGGVGMYALKDGGNFEMHSIDKSHQVKCGCWSPKGKQIVFGFPNGKLQQFKPDLTPAKTIACPAGVFPGPFDTIAIHWLSTYQFAVVFLQHSSEASPSLLIVNAPKGSTPSYINYNDICYSAMGPRAHQVTFTHIPQWNLLLVASANGVEVGILGTKDNAETPAWQQYMLLDEARIEMPLTEGKDETYPIGFALDTGTSHQVTIGETKMPVMPMVHVLSTHGHLVSFNFLNLGPGVVDICSPPPPVVDRSGEFRVLEDTPPALQAGGPVPAPAPVPVAQHPADMSFTFAPNAVTSTPAVKDRPSPLFGVTGNMAGSGNVFSQAIKPVASSVGFGQTSSTTTVAVAPFGAVPAASTTAVPASFGGFSAFGGVKTAETSMPVSRTQQQGQMPALEEQRPAQRVASLGSENPSELGKPLYTVPPTFAPPAPQQHQPAAQASETVVGKYDKTALNSNEINEMVTQMIVIQMNAFSAELKQLGAQSKGLFANIGKPEEMKACTKRLNDLQEIIQQANNREFEMDVQHLRHSLNEFYIMLAECRSKLEMFSNPEITRLTSISTFDPINRRQLGKLQCYLAANQVQLQQLQQQIDAQWYNYQDLVRRTSKTKIHIPSLDGVYQRMSKLKDIIASQRTKLSYIHTQLKQKGMNAANNCKVADGSTVGCTTIDSIADAILSMSLAHVVDENRSKLSDEKLSALRNYTRQKQQITIIKPQRPDRVGLKSEVIMETKLQSERKAREKAAATKAKAMNAAMFSQAPRTAAEVSQSAYVLPKPTATKAPIGSAAPQTTLAPAAPLPTATTPNFNVGAASPFVKTVAGVALSKADELPNAFATTTTTGGYAGAMFGTSNLFGGGNKVDGGVGQSQPSVVPLVTPIAFSAKVIDGGSPGVPASTPTTKSFAVQSPALNVRKENVAPQDEPAKPLGASTTFSASIGAANANATDDKLPPRLMSSGSFSFGNSTAKGMGLSSATAAPAPTATFGGAVLAGDSTSDLTVKTTAAPKTTALFSGYGKSISNTPTATTNIFATSGTGAANAASKGFSFGGAFEPSATATQASTNTPFATTATTTSAASADPTDTLLSTFNICKPTTKENGGAKSTAPANIFAGFSSAVGSAGSGFSFHTNDAPTVAGGDAVKTIFGSSTKAGGPFSFGTATSTSDTTPATVAAAPAVTATKAVSTAKPVTATTVTVAPAKSSEATPFSFASADLGTTVAAVAPTSAAPGIVSSTSVLTKLTAGASVFEAAAQGVQPKTAATTSIFGDSNLNAFSFADTAQSTGAPATTSVTVGAATTISSPFGTTATTTSPTTPTTSTTATPPAAAAEATTTTSTSIFGLNTNAFGATGSSVFSSMPKPDPNVFAKSSTAPTEGLFAASAAATTSPFSSPTSVTTTTANPSSGASLFGGASNAFGGASTTPGASIFGGGSTTTSPFAMAPSNTSSGGSIFGNTAKPAESANIFGGAIQPPASGSLFGQSTFGKSTQLGGNIFGSASNATQQQPAASSFGGGNSSSIFGAAATTTASTGSIFGGATSTGPSVFGNTGFGGFTQQTPTFSSPNNSFGQSVGASVAQKGFGSPEASAFAKPVFGGAPAFGSPPAFGGQPSFGGAATFGSPKGFGFPAPNVASPTVAPFGSPTSKNNLFEALGSTDSGLSFGNLAQTTNTNQPKPTFGGSSFMNYRA